ncbi:MAG: hypothetical protein JO324_00740 [Candidatus Eremiobacteraeota bacterium]|nr:hypothetical protein [Candidatus Eremiobacteraeota bacterium]
MKALYVAELSNGVVKILSNTYYRELGTITTGITAPVAATLDQLGNLYVANQSPGSIAEYAPGATSPSFTYTAGITTPFGVAVDNHGNVYEVDATGSINQYFQGFDHVAQACSVPGSGTAAVGVTVDSNNDVFVGDYNGSFATIQEYQGGLHGCNPTAFSFGVNGVATFAMDKNADLIFSDPLSGGGVFVVAPPYTSITRTIGSGFVQPLGVSLNKKNTLAFVADAKTGTVTVVNYQTGTNVTVLGPEHGITAAYGVVDGRNAVY